MTADAPDLVTLLYRADWTQLSLAADVSITIDHDLAELQADPSSGSGTGSGSGGPSRSTGDAWEVATDQQGPEVSRSTLLIAPGGRYRHEGADFSRGRDGDRSWRVDGDRDAVAEWSGTRQPALDTLLRPSWLLTGYTLGAGEPVTTCGRAALRVVATRRRGIRRAPEPRPRPGPLDFVEVIVDAELGILLRHAKIVDGQPLSVTELVSVSLDPAEAGDDTRFRPPSGWDGVRDEEAPSAPGSGGVSEKILSLFYNGWGALLKNSPPDSPDSFRQATQEDPEWAMPEQEPLAPDGPGAAPVSDEIVHLIYASESRWAPGIEATLHNWHDWSASFLGMKDYVRRVPSSGLGPMTKLSEVLAQKVPDIQLHIVSRLRIGGPDWYQVEHIVADHVSTTTVCDGEQCWRILSSESVMVGPATPVPGEIADLLDASWLLTARLTGGTETTVAGRRGYRIVVASDDSRRRLPPDEVVVDAELGFLLRMISRSDSRVVAWNELRDVTAYAGAVEDFRPDIPAGTRVTNNPQTSLDFVGYATQEVVKAARSKVEGLFGFRRGGDGD